MNYPIYTVNSNYYSINICRDLGRHKLEYNYGRIIRCSPVLVHNIVGTSATSRERNATKTGPVRLLSIILIWYTSDTLLAYQKSEEGTLSSSSGLKCIGILNHFTNASRWFLTQIKFRPLFILSFRVLIPGQKVIKFSVLTFKMKRNLVMNSKKCYIF